MTQPDYTQSSQSFSTTSTANNSGFMTPLAFMVQPIVSGPAALIIADSRGYGTTGVSAGGTVDTWDYQYAEMGWFERAAGLSMPVVNHARPSDEMYSWMHNRRLRYQGLSAIAAAGRFPEVCLLDLVVNDFIQAYTLAQVQPEEAQFVQDLRGFGCKVVLTATTDPQAVGAGGGTAVIWAGITAGGTGYGANQTFNVTVPGGTFTSQAIVTVTTNASGVVTQINDVPTYGQYSANPTSTNSCASNVCTGVVPTGGAGSGLTLSLFLTTNTPTATQTQTTSDNTAILARNAQLRSANFGSYAGIYDGVIDFNGITENGPGSDNWMPYCTSDNLHSAPKCIKAKAAYAAPILAAWAAQARTLN